MWQRPGHPLEQAEVRPVAAAATLQAEAAAEAWLRTHRVSGARVAAGEVFSAGGVEFAVSSCTPHAGGAFTEKTDLRVGTAPVPVLKRLQLTYLDALQDTGDADEKLYKDFIRPFLEGLREERRKEGGRHLVVLSMDQVLNAKGGEFGVRALDPAGRCGALDANTEVYVSQVETPSLTKVHVLPYKDTLPDAYSCNLFQDCLQPFLRAHPFAVYGEGDHFTYRGVRFRVMATDPPNVTARVCSQTLVYTDGEALTPTIWDFMPPELREDVRRLPRGLQALLLNTMANEEAVRGRLMEVNEVLRRGQGLQASEISAAGRTVEWRSQERIGETQEQCMVCLTEFADGECLRQLGCDHLFHRECVDEWLQRSPACPICKQSVSSSSSRAGAGRGRSGADDGGVDAAEGARLLVNARVALLGDCFGTVIGYDGQRQRFRVRAEGGGNGQESLVAADDMVQCIAGVRLVGLQQAEFNGLPVQVVGLDGSRQRYQVRLESGRVLAVRPERCVLPEGAIARVCGLRAGGPGARWNGHYGRVVRFDQPHTRHILAMPPRGHLVSVRPKNLRL